MTRNRKLAVAAAVAAVATAAATGATRLVASAGQTTSYRNEVYKLTYSDPAANASIVEWASLADGTWREDVDDQSFIAGADNYVVVDHGSGAVYSRSGRPSFIGVLNETPSGVLALKAYLKGDQTLLNHGIHITASKSATKTKLTAADAQGQIVFVTTVDEEISDQEAASSHVLDVTPVAPQVVDRELPTAASAVDGVTSYWFGRTYGKLHAEDAAEHIRVRTTAQVAAGMSDRGDVHAVLVLYERSGSHVTSATPGTKTTPEEEIQISSEALASGHAQAIVAALNGKNGDEVYAAFPHDAVTLTSGEAAIVVPNLLEGDASATNGFYVITSNTLISVTGDLANTDLASTASALRRM